jgi:hypothetical protein
MLTGYVCRFELFLLGEGEKKITEKVVTGELVPRKPVITLTRR